MMMLQSPSMPLALSEEKAAEYSYNQDGNVELSTCFPRNSFLKLRSTRSSLHG